MILRWTLWESTEGEAVQLALAVLNEVWEPQYEATLPCGPFHSSEDRRLELLDGFRRYLRDYGHQLALSLE